MPDLVDSLLYELWQSWRLRLSWRLASNSHFPRLSSVLRITTSPTTGTALFATSGFRRLSLKLRRYSWLQHFHTAALHFNRCFALLCRSRSSISWGGNSGNVLLFRYMLSGVRTGSWISSYIYPSGRLFSVISTSNNTSSSSFHARNPFPIVLFKAPLTKLIIPLAAPPLGAV